MTEYFQIELTQGQVARVSAEDFEELSKYQWNAMWLPRRKRFYATRNSSRSCGKKKTILMHRQIMGFPDGMQVDHIHGNTLDNRRSELRLATNAENSRNSKRPRNNTSGFKGVTWKKSIQRWIAQISIDGVNTHLGYFETPEAGHAAYCEAAKKYFGEFARAA